MARVLLNLSSQPAGTHAGVARFGIELARRLVASGAHDYTFRSQWSAEQLPPELSGSATLEVIPPVSNFLKDLLKTWVKAKSTHPASKFDLILNLDALGFARGGDRRMTIVHDIYYASVPAMFSRFNRLKQEFIHSAVIRRSHVVVGISEATSSEVRKFFPKDARKVRTVLSDSTMAAVTPSQIPQGLAPLGYVLAVANVTPNKNFPVLARAFAEIAAEHPGLKLVHVGGDEGETFESILAEKGLGDRLVRLRGIDDEVLAALYRDALCLVVPSLCEGFCLPLLEAQRFGCPTVFSDRSATGEVGGEGGMRFDPTDAKRLEADLRFLAEDAVHDGTARADLIAAGTRNAARFSWGKTVAGYENAIRDALRPGRS